MKVATITRNIRNRIRNLAFKLQSAIEGGDTWRGIEAIEQDLMEIITEEAARMSTANQRSTAYFESLPRPERDGTEPSKYATIGVLRSQHARVATAAAERNQSMSRIVGDLIDEKLEI